MRTLLRHTQTGAYFQGPDRWTDDPEGAYDFRFIDRAVRYIETWDLREVELALFSAIRSRSPWLLSTRLPRAAWLERSRKTSTD